MRIEKNLKMAFVLGVFSTLAAISGAQAGILLAGGDPGYVINVLTPGGQGTGFLNGGPILQEPRAIVYGADGSLYVLEAEDSGAPGIVYKYNSAGQYIGIFIGRGIYTAGATTVDLTAANNIDFSAMAVGPGGDLYIAGYEFDTTLAPFPTVGDRGMVLRFSGTTGAFVGIHVANGAGDGGSNIVSEPKVLAFDPAGNLYVGENGSPSVIQFNSTGAYTQVVIASGDPLMNEASGLTFFGGALYVSNGDGDNVLRVLFTGGGAVSSVAEFIPAGSGGLDEPQALAFGPDGLLYVVSSQDFSGTGQGGVLRYNAAGSSVGAYINLVPGSNDPYGFVFNFQDNQVPTLGQWSMFAMAVVLMLLGGVLLRRRSRART